MHAAFVSIGSVLGLKVSAARASAGCALPDRLLRRDHTRHTFILRFQVRTRRVSSWAPHILSLAV
jgi:hypothetical protein